MTEEEKKSHEARHALFRARLSVNRLLELLKSVAPFPILDRPWQFPCAGGGLTDESTPSGRSETTTKLRGPTLKGLDAGDPKVRVSAVQLAGLASVGAADIHYWSRSGLLHRDKKGHSSYSLKLLPKAKLMALFTKRLGMRAREASELAEQFLVTHGSSADAFTATVALAELLDKKMTALVDLILELDLLPRLKELLDEKER